MWPGDGGEGGAPGPCRVWLWGPAQIYHVDWHESAARRPPKKKARRINELDLEEVVGVGVYIRVVRLG